MQDLRLISTYVRMLGFPGLISWKSAASSHSCISSLESITEIKWTIQRNHGNKIYTFKCTPTSKLESDLISTWVTRLMPSGLLLLERWIQQIAGFIANILGQQVTPNIYWLFFLAFLRALSLLGKPSNIFFFCRFRFWLGNIHLLALAHLADWCSSGC